MNQQPDNQTHAVKFQNQNAYAAEASAAAGAGAYGGGMYGAVGGAFGPQPIATTQWRAGAGTGTGTGAYGGGGGAYAAQPPGLSQFAPAGGLLLQAQYLPTTVALPISLPLGSQLSGALPPSAQQLQQQQQQFLQHYTSLSGQPGQSLPAGAQQQTWAGQQPQQTWAVQQQQQQQQQQFQQQQQQYQQYQVALHSQAPLAQQQGGRGWGGQRLHPRPGPRPGEPRAPPSNDGSGAGPSSGGASHGHDSSRGGGGGRHGRGWRGGGHGRSGHSSPHADALLQELVATVRQLPRGQAPHEAVAGRLAGLDGRLAASLMKQLAGANMLAAGWEIFDWLRSLEAHHELCRLLDVFLYTAMISLCSASRRDTELALGLSREMAERGVPRNVHTFSALMNVCIKAGQHAAALDVWREMQEAGCSPNVVTYNTLIDVYGKTSQWAEALKALAEMKEKGLEPVTRTYNTLMIACNSSNQWHEALAVWAGMKAAGHRPNTTTFNALITANSKAGRLDAVFDVFEDMKAAGCERTVITYSALISACERECKWEKALQVFADMLREGCAPNIITYNSLITALAAGAQWERAAEVFYQLQRQAPPCVPDVVTYTALINAFEKGGQWRRALQAFEQMLQQGCRTDHVVYGAIVDALWDSGTAAAQARAARIYRAAISAGLVRPIAPLTAAAAGPALGAAAAAAAAAVVAAALPAAAADALGGGEVQELQLGSFATGSAVVAFFCYLSDQRERAVQSGPDSLSPRVVLRFARARAGRDTAPLLQLRDVLAAWLQARGAPFRAVLESVSAPSTRLESLGPELGSWLLSDGAALEVLPYRGGGAGEAVAAALQGAEEERELDVQLEAECRDAFARARRFEGTRELSISSMGAAYLSRRRELAAGVLRVAAAVRLPYEAAHDAVLLLDRLMSVAPQLREDLLAMASVTALRMVSGGGGFGAEGGGGAGRRGGGGAAETEAELVSRLAQATGLPTLGFQSMELNIQGALAGDTAAISAPRCLALYLRRIGAAAAMDALAAGAEPAGPQDAAAAGAGLRLLLDQALLDPEFLNYRPSATAAAALYCDRLRRGDTPPWPAAVAALTGYATLEPLELAGAVAAVQRLWAELSIGAPDTGGGGGDCSRPATAAQMAALFRDA